MTINELELLVNDLSGVCMDLKKEIKDQQVVIERLKDIHPKTFRNHQEGHGFTSPHRRKLYGTD